MEKKWFILRSKSRHENVVESDLVRRRIEVYLPKRPRPTATPPTRKRLYDPLFPGYVFVKPEIHQFDHMKYIEGSCGLLYFDRQPATIRTEELDNIRFILENMGDIERHEILYVGDQVQVVSGSLCGAQGILMRQKGKNRLVINAVALNKSFSLEIDAECVRRLA